MLCIVALADCSIWATCNKQCLLRGVHGWIG